MAILFNCVCSIQYTVDESQAGFQFTCPSCQQTVIIPLPPPPAPVGGLLDLAPPAAAVPMGMAPGMPLPAAAVPMGMAPGMPPPAAAVPMGMAPGMPPPAAAVPMGMAPGMPPPAAAVPAVDPMAELGAMFAGDAPAETSSARRRTTESRQRAAGSSGEAKRRSTTAAGGKRRSTTAAERGQSGSRRRKTATDGGSDRSSTRKRTGKGRRRKTVPDEEVQAAPVVPEVNKHVKKCHGCGEFIARKAEECPFCDAVQEREAGLGEQYGKQIKLAKLGAGVVALLVLIFVAVKMLGADGNKNRRGRRRRVTKKDEEEVAAKKKRDAEDAAAKKKEADVAAAVKKAGAKPAPGKKAGGEKKPEAGPKKRKNPFETYRQALAPLKEAQDQRDLDLAVEKLALDKRAKKICEAVLKYEPAGFLAGRCFRVLYALAKQAKPLKAGKPSGNLAAAVLLRAIRGKSVDGILFAVEASLSGGPAKVRESWVNGRSRLLRVGRAWGQALDATKMPSAGDLPLFQKDYGLARDGKRRLAILRVAVGDGAELELALGGFLGSFTELRRLTQEAFKLYAGKEAVALADPSSESDGRDAEHGWREWVEGYEPVRALLAQACSKTKNVPNSAAARRARNVAIMGLIEKGRGALPYYSTFIQAEPGGRGRSGGVVLGALIERVAEPIDAELLSSLLDRLNEHHPKVAIFYAAAALTVCEAAAVAPVMRLYGRDLLSLAELARILPDLSADGPEAKQIAAKLDEFKKDDRGRAFLVLASLGSKRAEEEVMVKKSQNATEILARLQNIRLERKLFDIAIGKEEHPEINESMAQSLLRGGASPRLAGKLIKLIRKEDAPALRAAEALIGCATPAQASALFKALKSQNSSISRAACEALIILNPRDLEKRFSALYNGKKKTKLPRGLVRRTLLELGSTKKAPRDEVVAESEKWVAKFDAWQVEGSGKPPRLPSKILAPMGKIAMAKDAPFFLKALAVSGGSETRNMILTLGRIRAKEASELLAGYIVAGQSMRGPAALSLGLMGDEAQVEGFRTALSGLKRYQRNDAMILMAISLLSPKKARRLALGLLDKGRGKGAPPSMAVGLGFALCRMEKNESEEPVGLAALVNHPESEVRQGVAEGVAFATVYKESALAEGVARILTPLLYDEVPAVRAAAVVAVLGLKRELALRAAYAVLRDDGSNLSRERSDEITTLLEPQNRSESTREQIFRLAFKGRSVVFREGQNVSARRFALQALRKRAGKPSRKK